MEPPEHYIELKNGKFDTDTPMENLAAIFQKLQTEKYDNKPLVIHFHGGLVNKTTGIGIADRLRLRYATDKDVCYPLFFVWEAGLFEVIGHNLSEILSEDLFKRILKHLKRYIVSKIDQDLFDGSKGGKIALLSDNEVNAKINANQVNLSENALLNDDQQQQLYDLLQSDDALKKELAGILVENGDETAKGLAATPVKSLVSQSFLNEIKSQIQFEPDAKGPVAIGKILWEIVKIAIAVVKRCINKTNHGIYVTIVEEILRKIYIEAIGSEIWFQMKKDTADAFEDGDMYGGRALIKQIAANYDPENSRRIVLIGHSTGAVYICNLLKYADQYGLDPDIKFDVVFLAPACTFKLFSDTIKQHEKRINKIVSFGMKDEVEIADHMVPVIYPSSLLYFVSGLLERNEENESFTDMPIVGMERFYKEDNVHASLPEVIHVKQFLADKHVWSVADEENGKGSHAMKHGDFDNDDFTLNSLGYIISNP